MLIETDAFSLGQVDSKLWAAIELEKCVQGNNLGPLNMFILGGWYALLHFILKVRNNIQISECRSIDLDEAACHIANTINNTWESDAWKFKAFPGNVNELSYPSNVNCVINTSAEHIKENAWFNNIPAGTICLIQSNNLQIPEHVATVSSLQELLDKFPFTSVLYKGEHQLPTYTRFMIIGIK